MKWFRKVSSKEKSIFTADLPQYAEHSIGTYTYGEPHIRRWQPEARLSIGKFCSIAAEVTILLGGEHRSDWITTYPLAELIPGASGAPRTGFSKGNVEIGHDVWIGYGATILSGVRIGNGAIVGARAVVSQDVPAYSVVVGNPCRVIRFRFSADIIERLERVAWWHWPIDRIVAMAPALLQGDPTQLLETMKKVDAHG